jgi:hypothetical protein
LHITYEKSMEDLFDFDINPDELLEEEVDALEENEAEPEEEEEVEYEEEVEDDVVEDDEQDVTPAKIFYDFVVDNGILSPIDNFDGNIETLKSQLEDLPVKSFERAVQSLPELSQAVVNYVFSKEINSVEDFNDFINTMVKPAYSEVEFDDVDDARDYLRDKYSKMGIYANDDDLEESLDLLEEKGTLVRTAKSLAEKDNAQVRESLNREIEVEKQNKLLLQKQQQEYVEKLNQGINDTLNELPWQETRKREALANLAPETINRKNELIRQSPRAIVQLADIYSYFNEKTGEFDFSKLIDAKADSKANNRLKDNYQRDKFSSAVAGLGKQLPNRKEKSIIEVVDFDYTE